MLQMLQQFFKIRVYKIYVFCDALLCCIFR